MRVVFIFILLLFGLFCQGGTVKKRNEKIDFSRTPSTEDFLQSHNIIVNEDFRKIIRTFKCAHLEDSLNDILYFKIDKVIFKSEPFHITRVSIILGFSNSKLWPKNDKIFKFNDDRIVEIYRDLTYDKVEEIGNANIGLAFTYDKGHLAEISCHHLPGSNGARCEDSILLNSDGSIREVKEFKIKCKQGCGQFQPLRQPGYYFISTNQVRIREKPDTKSKIIAELSKDVRVEVIKDAEKYEKIFPHFATWAQVKLDDGREGYVYGAFLRAPGEPDVVAIREKAEECKKVNRVKEK